MKEPSSSFFTLYGSSWEQTIRRRPVSEAERLEYAIVKVPMLDAAFAAGLRRVNKNTLYNKKNDEREKRYIIYIYILETYIFI